MPKTPHSPGPFIVSRLNLADSQSAFIEDADGRLLADMCRAFDDSIEALRNKVTPEVFREGNLYLLAESWNLLRAVKAAAHFLDDRVMFERLRKALVSGQDGDAERQQLLRTLRNAIARAEGEAVDLIFDYDYTDVTLGEPAGEDPDDDLEEGLDDDFDSENGDE